jgi:hypothetical protein
MKDNDGERFIETLTIAEDFMTDMRKIVIMIWGINYVARLGRRGGRRPILVWFTSKEGARGSIVG